MRETHDLVRDDTVARAVPRFRPPSEPLAALILALALSSLALMPSSANAAQRLPLTMEPNVPFPVRVFVLSLPTGGAPSRIRVTENGRRVDASLAPVGSKATPFSAVVLLDASLTMFGRPFVAARTAANTLIAGKPARSELALYGFAAAPFAVQSFSKSGPQLAEVVNSLRIRYGTAIWNTVILSSQKLRSRKSSAKAIVILTDAKPDTTKTRVGQAIAAARSAGARVFVVVAGPGGPQQRDRLNHLAVATGGFVVKVESVPQLQAAFARVSRTLSRQYILSYSSRQTKPGWKVRVRVRIDNATAAASYTVPPSPSRPKETAFLFTLGGVAALLVVVLLIPILLLAVLVFRAENRRRT